MQGVKNMKFPEPPQYRMFAYPLTLPPIPEETTLLDIPGVCRCVLRKIGADPALKRFEMLQNYAVRSPAVPDLALEAVIFLQSDNHPDWKELRIGIPLADLPPYKELAVQYTGTHFQLIADGKVLDEEYPYGEITGDLPPSPISARRIPQQESCTLDTPAQLWSPEGANTWTGDVSLGFFNGVFHLFYLYDRRHHCSKFAKGGHTWGHLSTRDFRSWQNDGIILDLEQQWQSFGTGTPFIHDGKLTLAYGIHSGRFVETPGVVPSGATTASTSDGVHFTPSGITFEHLPENPSVYHDADGSLFMYHGFSSGDLSLWRGEKWPDFRLICEHVVPSGKDSFMRNNLDCPAFFQWQDRKFLLVGFTAMWTASDFEFSDKTDLGEAGLDLYDGLEVPMVADIGNDRRILAGWLSINDSWGGVLGLRELCRMPDGIPGMHWMQEVMPPYKELQCCNGCVSFSGEGYFEFELEKYADLVLRFSGSGEEVEFRLNGSCRKAALLPASVPGFPLFRENPARNVEQHAVVAAGNLRNLKNPFKVRIMVRDERKWNGCIVDVEIAGCRTLIHHFPETHLTQLTVAAGNTLFKAAELL